MKHFYVTQVLEYVKKINSKEMARIPFHTISPLIKYPKTFNHFSLEEFWYFVGQGSEVSRISEVEEATSVGFQDKNPDSDMMAALTGEGGPLGSGMMPKIGRMSEQGEKALAECLEDSKVSKRKTPKPPKAAKEPGEVITKTIQEEVVSQKPEVLKCATEARKSALALKHLNYSGELVNGLMAFSKKMETVFERITTLTNDGVTEPARFKNILDVIKEQMKWYKQAEASFILRHRLMNRFDNCLVYIHVQLF